MLALVGVPLLGVPRSPTLGEHGHALAVDDAPFLTDHSILRNLSQGVRECSAGRRGAAKECLAAVREAAHRWLYTQPEGPGSAAPNTVPNRRKLSTSAAKDMPARPVSIRHPWRALQANWWMPFVDGWAHHCGAKAFDQSRTITRLDGDGDLSGALRSLHDKFSDYGLMHDTHLNMDMVEMMNMQLQGLSWAANPDYGDWEEACPYTEWQPRTATGANTWDGRKTSAGADMMGYKGAVPFHDKKKIFSDAMAAQDWTKDRDLYRRIRVALVGTPLDEFDAAIAKDDCGISRWTSNARERLSLEQHHPRAALGCLLPAAATLYAKMAELHPFIDGNSRTRTMMLNIQLARAGAHPVVLYNNGWGVYHMNNLEDLMQYLLGGYCAWEYVVATGKSPYVGHRREFDCAHPPYENHTDMRYMGANRSPIRLYDRETDECIIPGEMSGEMSHEMSDEMSDEMPQMSKGAPVKAAEGEVPETSAAAAAAAADPNAIAAAEAADEVIAVADEDAVAAALAPDEDPDVPAAPVVPEAPLVPGTPGYKEAALKGPAYPTPPEVPAAPAVGVVPAVPRV